MNKNKKKNLPSSIRLISFVENGLMDSPLPIEELIRELDQPDLRVWKLFAQTPDVKVYRKVDEDVKSPDEYLELKVCLCLFRNL